MTIPLLSLHQAEKRIASQTIIHPLDLTLHQGETLAVLGQNGSGKSTLLNMIGGFIRLNKGSRHVHLTERTLRIGYVPDRFPKMRFSGYEYLHHMGAIRGMEKEKLSERIGELLSLFEFDSEAARRPIAQYSKGMIQKINMMQGLLELPDLLLLDEPFSGLDRASQEQVNNLLSMLHAQGIGLVVTSHLAGTADRLAGRQIVLHQGRIAEHKQIATSAAAAPAPAHDPDVRCMHIECRLPESEDAANWRDRPGVLACRTSERGSLLFRLQPEHSNRFLKAVLEQNGHIISVREEREDNT